ncbi:transmembrane protein 254 isoform X2 [Gopherus flavomarginatus]|uniref:transmembrane protein 254 isoform X2 n=1 Tax=Gopherus flavomarginatus TaxID=286002 RepID=UPI0021CC1D39|nr:transmembrane protein 254 isoform X2 [Gopherus flavomarginatus]
MEAPPLNPGGYFRCASRFWMGVIAVSIGYFAWTVFLPSTIPYENLGQLGHVTKYLVDRHPKLLYNGFWLAWGIHIAEALYSIKLCKTKGITDSSVQRRWFIQTFLFDPMMFSSHLDRCLQHSACWVITLEPSPQPQNTDFCSSNIKHLSDPL